SADRENGAVRQRRPGGLPAEHLQGPGGRQMRPTPDLSIASLAAALLLTSSSALAQQQQPPSGPPLVLARPEAPAAPPATITLQDALDRAKQNDLQFQAAVTDADSAREDRVQARSSLLPGVSFTTQYLGNSPNGVNPNGRFVSLDGVQ